MSIDVTLPHITKRERTYYDRTEAAGIAGDSAAHDPRAKRRVGPTPGGTSSRIEMLEV